MALLLGILLAACRAMTTVFANKAKIAYEQAAFSADRSDFSNPMAGLDQELYAAISSLVTVVLTFLLARRGKRGFFYAFLFHAAYWWLYQAVNEDEHEAWPVS